MRGRKPKPTALHILHGTWRRDRHGPKPAPIEPDAAVAPPSEPVERLELQAATRLRRRREGAVEPPDGA
jgi:hypothetical protein